VEIGMEELLAGIDCALEMGRNSASSALAHKSIRFDITTLLLKASGACRGRRIPHTAVYRQREM
jgi:hypothetical protein